MTRKTGSKTDTGIGGLIRGVGSFVELLGKLAEDENMREISGQRELGDDKGFKAVYGFSIRVGSGGTQIEKFGNVKEHGGEPTIEEAREPMVDVFDEGDHFLLVAELPGVDERDIKIDVRQDIVVLDARHQDRKYQKEVLLAAPVDVKRAKSSYRNGVFELELPKAT